MKPKKTAPQRNTKRTASPLLGKTPSESAVTMTELVLPPDANTLGTAFGGKIMSWIDIAAAMAATRHARRTTVTASIDALHFLAPVRVGDAVHLTATVNFTAHTSMEVGVRVDSEDLRTGERRHTATAYTTFVALDDNHKPTQVPPIVPETAEEKRRHREAIHRREARMALAKTLRSSRPNG